MAIGGCRWCLYLFVIAWPGLAMTCAMGGKRAATGGLQNLRGVKFMRNLLVRPLRGGSVAAPLLLMLGLMGQQAAAVQALPPIGMNGQWHCRGAGGCSIGPVEVNGTCRLTVRGEGPGEANVMVDGRRVASIRFVSQASTTGVLRLKGRLKIEITSHFRQPVQSTLSCAR